MTIEEGLAIDDEGRELYITKPQHLHLAEFKQNDVDVYVVLNHPDDRPATASDRKGPAREAELSLELTSTAAGGKPKLIVGHLIVGEGKIKSRDSRERRDIQIVTSPND